MAKVGIRKKLDLLKRGEYEGKLSESGIVFKEYMQPGKLVLGIRAHALDAVLLDGNEEDITKWLQHIRRSYEVLPIVVVSNKDIDVKRVVEIMKFHINDFLISPTPEELAKALNDAISQYRLWARVHKKQHLIADMEFPAELHGVSRAIVEVRDKLQSFMEREFHPILIYAIPGSGRIPIIKQLCTMHKKDYHLIVNEFDAKRDLKNIINKTASPDVLYIHGIESYSRQFQEMLIELMNAREDVKIIISTTLPPMQLVEQKILNKELYQRIADGYTYIPPLVERPEDIPMIALAYLYRFSETEQKYFVDFSIDALNALVRYPWPGDVMQLRTEISRIVWKYNAPVVSLDMLSDEITEHATQRQIPNYNIMLPNKDKILPLDVVINRYIEQALKIFDGDINKSARALGIGRATIYRRIAKFGLKRSRSD